MLGFWFTISMNLCSACSERSLHSERSVRFALSERSVRFALYERSMWLLTDVEDARKRATVS